MVIVFFLYGICRKGGAGEFGFVLHFQVFPGCAVEIFLEHLVQIPTAGKTGFHTDIQNIQVCFLHKSQGMAEAKMTDIFLERHTQHFFDKMRKMVVCDIFESRKLTQGNMFGIMLIYVVHDPVQPHSVVVSRDGLFFCGDVTVGAICQMIKDIQHDSGAFQCPKRKILKIDSGTLIK